MENFQGQKKKKKKNLAHLATVSLLPLRRRLQVLFAFASCEIPSTSAKTKVVAAFLLTVLRGKAPPSSGNIKDILGSVGAETEDSQIELLLKEVKGKDLAELIAAGREKLASVPSGAGHVFQSIRVSCYTLVKEGVEDWRRKQQDIEVNNRKVGVHACNGISIIAT